MRLREVKGRPGTALSPPKEKKKKMKESRSEPVTPVILMDDFDEDSDDVIMGAADVDVNAVSIKRKVGDDEEEELELVFIDGLGCYYCPVNQQYYQIDE